MEGVDMTVVMQTEKDILIKSDPISRVWYSFSKD